jgi:hypothetical protein
MDKFKLQTFSDQTKNCAKPSARKTTGTFEILVSPDFQMIHHLHAINVHTAKLFYTIK